MIVWLKKILALFVLLFMVTFCKKETVKMIPFDLWKEYDKNIPSTIASQAFKPGDPYHGSIPDVYAIHHPHSCPGFVLTLTWAFVSKASGYYLDSSFIPRMEAAMDYFATCQHDDGTIDLLTTNFHSTPDMAFATEPLAISFKLLSKIEKHDLLPLKSKIKNALLKAGNALTAGGIHTPNHRWVVCMALARIHELFPDKKYTDRIQEWLAEGIDIDADGQYNEKSTSVYSPITNKAFITLSKILNDDTLLEPVRKNLALSQYLMHSNGELVTETSRRQDQYQARQSDNYYFAYKYMAKKEGGWYAGMASALKKRYGEKIELSLVPYLAEDNSFDFQLKDTLLNNSYDTLFQSQGIARWSDGKQDISIINKNSTLFNLFNNDAVLQAVRFASAFFGKGQFKADSLIKIANGYRLIQNLEGPYYQPFPKDSILKYGSDWDNLPRQNRKHSEVQKMKYQLDVLKQDGSWFLNFSADGTDGVPCAIELNFRNEGILEGVKQSSLLNDVFFLTANEAKYTHSNSTIRFGPNLKLHEWTEIRGAEPKLPGKSVYITGYTPFSYSLQIQTSSN